MGTANTTRVTAPLVVGELGEPAQGAAKEGLSLVVISPNAPYRRALVGVLRHQPGMLIEAHRSSVARVMKESPEVSPDVVMVDGCAVNDVLEARKAWPDAVLVCLLDYIGDWDSLASVGVDRSVLKDKGVAAILELLAQVGESLPVGA